MSSHGNENKEGASENTVESLNSMHKVDSEQESPTDEQQSAVAADENEVLQEELPVPKDNKQYKKKEYWDERFGKENAYEWLGGFSEFQSCLLPHLPTDNAAARILIVGCGNSDFSHELVAVAGFTNVINIDFSPVVIESMRKKYPEEQWQVADMLKLEEVFSTESFDYVIDKAAMDALVTDEGDPWNPSDSAVQSTSAMVQSVSSVLKQGGKFIQISFQQPHFRKKYLSSSSWKVGEDGQAICTESVDVGMGYYLFSMIKG